MTAQQAASALVEALVTEHRTASAMESMVLLPLVGQAREIEAELRRFAAARLEVEKIREDELAAARVDERTRAYAGREALEALVSTINATGGLVEHADGTRAPAGEPDWIDLGEAYALACVALGCDEVIESADGREAARGDDDARPPCDCF